MLEILRIFNPEIKIHSVRSSEFAPFGKYIGEYDVSTLIETANTIPMPKEGASYELSIPKLECDPIKQKLQNELFGETDIQIGYCWGYNNRLNALEWHKSSEVNIAVTPFILLLGKIDEMDITEYNSENVKAFLVDTGDMVEIYGTSLHFCPCQATKNGFRSIVILPQGTNALLQNKPNDKLLFKNNKWLICHDKNKALIEKGVYPGLHGENYEIRGV